MVYSRYIYGIFIIPGIPAADCCQLVVVVVDRETLEVRRSTEPLTLF